MKYALLAYSRGETSGERRTREMPPVSPPSSIGRT